MRQYVSKLLLAIGLFAVTVEGQNAKPELSLQSVATDTSEKGIYVVGLGDELRLTVSGLSNAIAQEKFDPQTTFVLSIGGRSFPGLPVRVVSSDVLSYELKRTTETRDAWNALLGRPTAAKKTNVPIRLRRDQKFLPADQAKTTVTLRIFYPVAFRWAVGVFLVLVGLFIWFARMSNVIRDTVPPDVKPEERPYSLARFQMAWWFFIIFGAFLFLFVITLSDDTLTPQALMLMGIGTGTALGAAVIDANKRSSADAALDTLVPQRAKLAAEVAGLDQAATDLANTAQSSADKLAAANAKALRDEQKAKLDSLNEQIKTAEAGRTKPVSENFIIDILTDANGISFHRFQIFAWTITLGIIFCYAVWEVLAMPPFNETLIALLGISSGTYLGFKLPEKQS